MKIQDHLLSIHEKLIRESRWYSLIQFLVYSLLQFLAYSILQLLARLSIWTYFRHLKVNYRAPIPMNGPMVVASNHTNMVFDPILLTDTFPHGRACHFWALARFFQVPLVGQLLWAGGVLSVDAHTHSNGKLFESTTECLEKGGVIALFPEGTSYTQPNHLPFKDGLSWAAFEYLEQQKSQRAQEAYLPIVPVGITYTAKNKWRSDVMVEYGEAIIIGPSDLARYQKDPKNAVKELTDRIVEGVEKGTVDATDWDTFYAASEARFLLFGNTTEAHLEKYVRVLQSLIQLFDTDLLDGNNSEQEPLVKERKEIKKQLVICFKDLKRMKLSTLDIRRYDNKAGLTQTAATAATAQLVFGIISAIPHLPLLIPNLIIHSPLYVYGQSVNRYEVYTESMSQNKVIGSITLSMPMYFVWFVLFCWWMKFTLVGLGLGVILVPLIAWSHIQLVDTHYGLVKNVAVLARVFMAVFGWGEGRRELELVIQRRIWCFHRVRSLIVQLAKLGNSYARTLVELGHDDIYSNGVVADGENYSDDGGDLVSL